MIGMWRHTKEIGKNWFTHLLGAFKIALIRQVGVIRCFLHGVIPDLDTQCAQSTVAKVNDLVNR